MTNNEAMIIEPGVLGMEFLEDVSPWGGKSHAASGLGVATGLLVATSASAAFWVIVVGAVYRIGQLFTH